ncbi:MAG: hypothetical protein KatS3mg118_0864 [Paracoccaceae bacterium]|nr:MAG: hypothetical protein KatS3mg118_0864 [Paracoccaceae bacterium]
MSDSIWFRREIESPCVKVCVIHPQARICVGCHRTADEIAAWSRMTAEERRRIMAELPGRCEALRAAANRPSRRRAQRRAAQSAQG